MKLNYTQQLVDDFEIESFIESNLDKTKLQQHDWISACCPFHNDKNPSFSINSKHGGWKCYTCQKSGTFVTFLKDYLLIDFEEVITFLKEEV